MNVEVLGTFVFGLVIGWMTYFTMRYSKDHQISDIAVAIGAIGGGAVLKLFGSGGELFAVYSLGLGGGFFVYLIILLVATLGTDGKKGLVDQNNQKNPFMGRY